MAVPSQVQNLSAEQADGQVLLSWDAVTGSDGYIIAYSNDGVNYIQLTSSSTNTLASNWGDGFTLFFGVKIWYKVAATSGPDTGPYSSPVAMVSAPPSEMSLMELRLRAQQTADRVGSQFVTNSEWNSFIRLAMYELYDLLIGAYEDYFATQQVTITTNGSQQYYPLPDGISTYPSIQDPQNPNRYTFFTTSQFQCRQGDVYESGGYQFTCELSVASSNTVNMTSIGPPSPPGTQGNLLLVSGDVSVSYQIMPYSYFIPPVLSAPAPAFYKMVGVDLAVNTSTTNPAWVTLKKFNFIDRNKYIYPNSTSTIYGVYNQAYRIMGQQIEFIPVPAGNQTIRLWYIPRLPALLQDQDITTLGFSGWLRYPIVRAAKYALDKEEGADTSKLDAELLFLKQRIQEMASNRDVGAPDTISETRRDGIYGGTGWGNGMGGGNAGW